MAATRSQLGFLEGFRESGNRFSGKKHDKTKSGPITDFGEPRAAT
jgi:hypothetical protein